MTPTRYPGWRILGFILALNNIACLIAAFILAFNGEDTSLVAVGWVTKGIAPSDSKFLTLVFSLALTVIGAAISVKRPARGFILLGAGYFVSVLSMAVLFPWKPEVLPAYLLIAAVGLLYSWLGVKQSTADHG